MNRFLACFVFLYVRLQHITAIQFFYLLQSRFVYRKADLSFLEACRYPRTKFELLASLQYLP